MLRSVDSPHYHLWTDALHARHLARDAKNAWDLGTYVRWTINTSWTAFEATCEHVLNTPGIGNDFKHRFNSALAARGAPRPDWGTGLWQRVLKVYGWRKDYVHARVPQARLFAGLPDGEESIKVLREAIKDLHRRLGLSTPAWVEDDANPVDPTTGAHGTVIRTGASQSDPQRVRVTYVYHGKEYESEVLPPGVDPTPAMEDLLRTILVPIIAIRSYRGETLLDEWELNMRGT